MDRASERIEQHIDREREVLRSNLEELEDRVRSVVDWRRHYRSNPAVWIGCALGGGLLLALATAPRVDRRRGLYRTTGPRRLGLSPELDPAYEPTEHRRREISRAWRTIESALIGVAAAKLKNMLAQVLPGFREQLARREGAGYVHDPSDFRSQH